MAARRSVAPGTLAIALAVAAALLAAPWAGRTAAAAPADPTKATPRSGTGPVAKSPVGDAAGVSAARRFLAEQVDLDADKTSVADVLKRLADGGGSVSLVVDPDADAAKLEQRVVSVRVKQVSREAVLKMVLGHDFAFRAEPNLVRVMTRQKYLSDLTAVNYPVKNLLAAGAGAGSDQEAASLQDIIKRSVNCMAIAEVAPWAVEGGNATMEYRNGVLVILQTPSGHERVSALLEQLAAVKAGKPPLTKQAARENAETAATRRRLKDRIDLECDNISLADALVKVSVAAKGLTIVLDPDIAVSGIDVSKPQVNLRLKQVPVESALKQLLGEDLACIIKPGYLLVTTSIKTQSNLQLVVYPLRLKAAARAAEGPPSADIIDSIMRSIGGGKSPGVAAWAVEGGPASIEYFTGCLVVTQTEEGHRLIQELLTRKQAAGR